MVACTACVTYVMCAYVTLAVLAARIGIFWETVSKTDISGKKWYQIVKMCGSF